jgi:hypothetical protein
MKNGNYHSAGHPAPLRTSVFLRWATTRIANPITLLWNIMKLRTIQQVSRGRHPTTIYVMAIKHSCAIFEKGRCPATIRAWLAEYCPATPIELLAPLALINDESQRRAFDSPIPETTYLLAGMGAVHAELFRQAWCNRQYNAMTEPDGLRLLAITLASRPNDYRPSRWPVSLLVSAREQAVTC